MHLTLYCSLFASFSKLMPSLMFDLVISYRLSYPTRLPHQWLWYFSSRIKWHCILSKDKERGRRYFLKIYVHQGASETTGLSLFVIKVGLKSSPMLARLSCSFVCFVLIWKRRSKSRRGKIYWLTILFLPSGSRRQIQQRQKSHQLRVLNWQLNSMEKSII